MRIPSFIGLAVALFSLGSQPNSGVLSKYKKVEAYEIRPGVLAMPKYGANGQVCEVGVVRQSYSPELIRIGESFSNQEIDQIVDDLAPSVERGKKAEGFLADMVVVTGVVMTETTVYENITVHRYGAVTTPPGETSGLKASRYVTIAVQWTNRNCR
jgi:hypothetical protein